MNRFKKIKRVNEDSNVYGECKIHGHYENWTDVKGCPVCDYNNRNPQIQKIND